MLQFLFYKLLTLSVCASSVFIIFMAVFWLFRRILSAKQRYYLLFLPVLLFLIPVSFGAKTFVMQEQQKPSFQTADMNTDTGAAQIEDTPEAASVPVPNIQQEVPSAQKTIPVKRYINTGKDYLVYVWLVCAVVLILYKGFHLIRFKKSLKKIAIEPTMDMQYVFDKVNKGKQVRLSCFDGVSTPFITGIFRPVLFMPNTPMSEFELYMIVQHELTHIKRHDLLMKAIVDFISIIHFFNPFVYILKNKINTYCELSCDETITKQMDIEQCRAYGKMLLSLMKQKNRYLNSTACLSENEQVIKKRLEIIMKKNRIGKCSAIVGIVLICMCTAGSIVFANTIGRLNYAAPPKAIYQAEISYINFSEKGQYDTVYTKDTTAAFMNFMGNTAFQASYYGMPDELKQKSDQLAQDKKYDESLAIFEDTASYTDRYTLKMDKKVRGYGDGDGYGMEGLFTLLKNDEIIFERQTGYLNSLPPCAENWDSPDTSLYVEYEKDGKIYTYSLSVRFDMRTEEQSRKNRMIFAEMDKSRQTRRVFLGELVEAVDNGSKIDTEAINKKLLTGTQPWENSIAVIEYNSDMQIAQAVFPIGWRRDISVWRGEKVTCNADTMKGSFKIMGDCITDFVPVTVSGLSNPIGGFVELKSNDGMYYAKYKIVPEILKPLSVKGTREVSEFMTEDEPVFIGTPREQDEFDRDEHSIFYKRIVTDDNGKVLAIVPIEYQHGENVNIKTDGSSGRTGATYQYVYSWQQMFDNSSHVINIDGSTRRITKVLQDAGTWWNRAVVPPENQFFTEINN